MLDRKLAQHRQGFRAWKDHIKREKKRTCSNSRQEPIVATSAAIMIITDNNVVPETRSIVHNPSRKSPPFFHPASFFTHYTLKALLEKILIRVLFEKGFWGSNTTYFIAILHPGCWNGEVEVLSHSSTHRGEIPYPVFVVTHFRMYDDGALFVTFFICLFLCISHQ